MTLNFYFYPSLTLVSLKARTKGQGFIAATKSIHNDLLVSLEYSDSWITLYSFFHHFSKTVKKINPLKMLFIKNIVRFFSKIININKHVLPSFPYLIYETFFSKNKCALPVIVNYIGETDKNNTTKIFNTTKTYRHQSSWRFLHPERW